MPTWPRRAEGIRVGAPFPGPPVLRRWAAALLLAAGLFAGGGAVARAIATVERADVVIVRKSERRLYLLRNGQVLRSFHVALGLEPEGHKTREGDFRTPEGRYYLTERNADSDYFLSIRISYPNDSDLDRARRGRVPAGGAVMIHGQPNRPSHSLEYYRRSDWTNGCIAVTNAEMVDIWLMTTVNTPIEILP
jgi:murein L,D-transpeptidase YafK